MAGLISYFNLNKKIIVSLVFLSFFVMTVFSFSAMSHGLKDNMQGDCPFLAFGASLCSQDIYSTIFHHISAYQSFFNVPISFYFIFIISFLLFFVSLVILSFRIYFLDRYLLNIQNFVNQLPNFSKIKLLFWLSLFENSPSVL